MSHEVYGGNERRKEVCTQVASITKIETTVEGMKMTQERNFKKLFEVLEGNGDSKNGLVTRTALNSDSIRRLWQFAVFFACSIFGIAFYLIREALIHGN